MSTDNPTRTTAPDYKTIYTNFVEAGYGPFDISLAFNESVLDGDNFMVTRLARVIMTPAEAVAVIDILKNVINNYEQTWGKIVPPVFQPSLTKWVEEAAEQLGQQKKETTEGD